MPDWINKSRPWALACEIDLTIDLDTAPGPLDGRMQSGIRASGAIRVNPDDEDLEATWKLDLVATIQVSGTVTYAGTLALSVVLGVDVVPDADNAEFERVLRNLAAMPPKPHAVSKPVPGRKRGRPAKSDG